MYVHVPFAEMREAPAFESKVVSQAIFSERVEGFDRSGDWILIQTPDSYRGWVRKDALIEREEYPKDVEVGRVRAHIYAVNDIERAARRNPRPSGRGQASYLSSCGKELAAHYRSGESPDLEEGVLQYGPLITLPFGSKLQLLDSADPRWNQVALPDGRKGFIQKGDLSVEPFDLATFGNQFLGVPYTWGGRCSFGFDCSGFIQMIYGRMGVGLPRDARDQILDPRGKKVGLEELVLGDLIFWGTDEGSIKHVGMFLKGESFIHTSSRENSPYLRVSKLSDLEWSCHGSAAYPFRTFRRIDTSLKSL